ncbi:bifunctional 5,10-methylenetetrahydrofolate dehydrogenase/5,10-methenyltetrahydrofolate cyclohydrolase [Schleiferilactobacillus shenzhenensis]|uniref:Bifunctional protein FolD n=1 Tax=Schleiferilactobacillus shenzhenensis LY-73 TaxID=1231336 RepID=U4TL20_9LACO|nr:bifunctional 5,10-methylenetetrahydrofolate dehydrogenase/5,10-methenyltetrahydrofolate cyclohydrolase [Schleiferilactobacillus shenzhenensis]ERL65561.1 FolD [Schleiferilactobacillus shenzhenensis LY-73]
MTTVVDGRALANDLLNALPPRIQSLQAQGVVPALRIIQVGDDPASTLYIRNKERRAAKLGIDVAVIQLPATVSQAELLAKIAALNADPAVHAILVQMPLPGHLDDAAVVAAIDPAKDADGFTPTNAGRLWSGDPGPVPATPAGIMAILQRYKVPLRGARAVMVGRSRIVGRPMAAMLLNADATVTVAHSQTKDLASVTRTADIVIIAVGIPHFLTAAMVKPGAVVIDVGIDRLADGKVTGDVDFAAVAPLTSVITPVPRGVGPLTVAELMIQTVALTESQVRHEPS